MFNLVKYRYLFLIISLIVIVPGTISLIFFHLQVGIDFAGGSSIEFRPQKTIQTTEEVKNYLAPLHLGDEQITFGDDKTLAGSNGEKSVWVRLNTQVDANTLNSIQTTLTNKYPKVHVQPLDVPTGGKTVTLLTLTGFDTAPQTSDIKQLLSKIPNTTNPAQSGSSISSATPTPQATATATSTPTATATPTTASSGTIPVNVVDVSQGTSTQIVRILTTTTIENKGNGDQPRIQGAFLDANGPYLQFTNIASVGGSVAAETTQNAVLAVLAAALFILLYVWFSFRKVTKAWRYGACAIIAMLHDVLVILGVFSILGVLFKIQIDSLFITALLTIVGFSVHDTIVVFDRIRENMQRRTTESFEQVVNASLIQTMARSLNTSLTVLFALGALTIFSDPGSTTHTFTLTLLIGIFSGTYSSIFNASMLLVIWEKGELGFKYLSRDRNLPPGKREARELVRSRG